MKAEVEPLPFVPAMCMRFKRLKSSGYIQAHTSAESSTHRRYRWTYPISDPLSPLDHLSYRLLVQTPPRLAYCVHHRKVGLQRVEGGNSILLLVSDRCWPGGTVIWVPHRFVTCCFVPWRNAAQFSECQILWISILRACRLHSVGHYAAFAHGRVSKGHCHSCL